MPTYVLLSEKNASADGTADRRLACAAERLARSLNPRYDGTAIASRMPMITITTSSSISVKPSSRCSRCRNLVINLFSFVDDEHFRYRGCSQELHPFFGCFSSHLRDSARTGGGLP